MAERLPYDLLYDVLLRLPTKSLLRFRSVCKSWLSIISSHRFAKSHLAITSAATGDDQTLIMNVCIKKDSSFSLFHPGSVKFGVNLNVPYSQGVYPLSPIYPFYPCSRLGGSDCGMVCVQVSEIDIYLWNPATKCSKLISPYTLPHYDKHTLAALGFGFDHIDFDFKVVRVVSPSFSAEVYSSNRNSWQNIDPKPTGFPYDYDFHVCLHGFLFTKGDNGMMAFDLNKEVFICDINLPVNDSNPFVTRIADFKDSVAIVISMMDNELGDKINLWTLDDEACLYGGGVKASWTLVLDIDVGERVEIVYGLFNSANFLLENEIGSRFLYNSDKKVFKYVPRDPYFDTPGVFKYTKSLFSIAGSKLVRWAASSTRLQDELDSS